MANTRITNRDGGDGVNRSQVTTSGFLQPSSPVLPVSPVWPKVDGFEVLRLIGQGGMGTVFEAQQLRPRRTVALKVMKAGVDLPSLYRRFELEIQALATLEHPNVARVYDAGTTKDGGIERPYYAMEYIASGLAIDVYAARHNLGVRQRIELFLKVCDAVYAGHCRGIVHRDLKPDNILVDASGEPKVIDFGVARILGGSLPLTAAETGVGQLLGTVRYMSPEQVEARPEAVDARSDVYTLGVILYELLTGTLPYELENRSLPEISRVIRETPPKQPSSIRRTVTGDLETIVLKAIEKSRDQRYQSASAFRDDLARWLRGEPIEARRTTVLYLLTRRFRQAVNRAPTVSVILAAVVIAVLMGTFGYAAIYQWTPVNYSFRSALVALGPSVAPPISDFNHVRVIEIDADSLGALQELALLYEIEGVRAYDMLSARPLSGALMQRLAEADVAVVAWDLAFRSPSDGDEGFVAGVKALRERGIPVLVVNPMWGVREDGMPDVSPNILPHVRYAFPAIYWGEEGPLRRALPPALRGREGWAHIALAVDRGRPHAIAGFAVEAVAAYRQPFFKPAVRLRSERNLAEIHYHRPSTQPGLPDVWLPQFDTIRLSGIGAQESNPLLNILPSDLTVVYSVQMPAEETLRRSTHSYAWALRAPLGEVREALAGRVVMIGYTDGQDLHNLGLGRSYHGVHIQAAATENLLQSDPVRLETGTFVRTMIAAGCLLGLIGGVWFGNVRWRGVAIVIVAAAAFIFLSVWLYAVHRFIFNPLLPATALVLTALIVNALNRSRREFAI